MRTNGDRSIRMVVFDWAGTVADFGCFAPVRPFIQALAAVGIEITARQAREPMGLAKRDHLEALFGLPEVARQWERLHGRPWTTSDVDKVFQEHFVPQQLACVDECNRIIPGLLDCMDYLRGRGIVVGTTTGYFPQAADRAYASARAQGFRPDHSVCPADVPAGRPAPWMIYRNMEALGVYPARSVVKVGDTLFDIQEGLNAGAWTVGVTDSSSEVGLTFEEFSALDDEARRRRTGPWAEKLRAAGAHEVTTTVAALPAVIQAIEERLARGERP